MRSGWVGRWRSSQRDARLLAVAMPFYAGESCYGLRASCKEVNISWEEKR